MLPGIHGLRGIAALAIVLFHIKHLLALDVPSGFEFVGNQFAYGVHLFFVVSAFSLMHSTSKTLGRPTWAQAYFVKRFFRIAPLFYTVLLFMVVTRLLRGAGLPDLADLLLNISLTFGLAPWTGLVWAGWTVGVEVIFYVLFPVALLTVRTIFGALLLVFLTLLISLNAREVLDTHYGQLEDVYRYNYAYFSFLPNLVFFSLGVLAYRAVKHLERSGSSSAYSVSVPVILGFLLVASADSQGFFPRGTGLAPIAYGLVFLGLCIWQYLRPAALFANRVLGYLGERSYSLYLLHPILIVGLADPAKLLYAVLASSLGSYAYFVVAAMIIAALIAVSEISYRLVEVPGIRLGRKINARRAGSVDPSLGSAAIEREG